jgi:hypothetical protein
LGGSNFADSRNCANDELGKHITLAARVAFLHQLAASKKSSAG